MAQAERTLVIFGAGGDLSTRLLLPALGQLLSVKPDLEVQLIGVNRTAMTDDAWRDAVRAAMTDGGADEDRMRATLDGARFLEADITKTDDLKRVLDACEHPPALYFAVGPSVAQAACEAMLELELPEGVVFALEKPFGVDRDSAHVLNRTLERLVHENAIHRVDHFFGKSTVLNLLGIRFANRIFEQSWNAENVASVEIVYDEALGLEGRAGYYDRAGALVDMIQSHLLVVLAVVAMEPPSSIDADDLRGEMTSALRAVRVDPSKSRRARYTAGDVDGRMLPAYVDEDGVDPSVGTETLAQVEVTVENWRWSGVPFLLRSGKAIGHSRKELVITFREPPHLPDGLIGASGPSVLSIGLEKDDITLEVEMNGGGDPFDLERVELAAEFGKGQLRAYGEVLWGVLTDDPLLSLRGDIVEENWRIVDPVIAAWKSGEVPLDEYPAGGGGPDWPALEVNPGRRGAGSTGR
jgi:glucose-6-phosphate 1-dehydrogenase